MGKENNHTHYLGDEGLGHHTRKRQTIQTAHSTNLGEGNPTEGTLSCSTNNLVIGFQIGTGHQLGDYNLP